MVRNATNARVANVEATIERPVDRARKRDATRTNSGTASVSGSGASGTLKTNQSSTNWYIDTLTVTAPGAGIGDLAVELTVENASGTVITQVGADTYSYPIHLDGQVMKPGWSLKYDITQDTSNSHTVTMYPVIRKPEPGSEKTSNEESGDDVQIDSFEDGSLGEYSGDTGSFSVTSADALHLDNSLEATGTGNNRLESSSGLNAYPERGDSFTFWTKATNLSPEDMRAGCQFGVNGLGHHYLVRVDYDNGEVAIVNDDGNTVDVADKSPSAGSVEANQWDKVRVDWKSSGITATLTIGGDGESVTAEASDSDLVYDSNSGDFGWFSSISDGTENLRFDHAKIV